MEDKNIVNNVTADDQSDNNNDEELDLEDFFDDDDSQDNSQDDNKQKLEEDSDKTTNESGEESDTQKKKVQSKEERAHFAQLKREQKQREQEEAEAKRLAELQKVREEATLEAQLDTITENPFTKTPIKDKYDLETYKLMREIVKNGGDPLKDLPAYLTKNAREVGLKQEEESKKTLEAQQNAIKQQEEIRKQVNDGFNEIRAKYNVNTKDLTQDKTFMQVATDLGLIDGKVSVETAYLVYLQKLAFAKKEETNDDVSKIANKVSTSPSAQGIGNKKVGSPMELTDEEYIALQKQENDDFF